MRTDWILSYIGLPWINGRQDCWALVRDVYQKRLGIDLPLYNVDAHNTRQVIKSMRCRDHHSDWCSIDRPVDLCLTFFSASRHLPTHVAVYLDMDGGRYLHTSQRTGCVFDSPLSMERHGWRDPQYYQHRLHTP